MLRFFVLIFLTAYTVRGQDSTVVKEFCVLIGQTADEHDLEFQISELAKVVNNYVERESISENYTVQDGLRFQYRLARELKRSCPNYKLERVRLIPKSIIDLEDRLTKQQIDSLAVLSEQIKQEKEVYLYTVTIDDFYPDPTIIDFTNRYRDYWVPWTLPKYGSVLVAISITHRQVRISTGNISMEYLTDKESEEVISVMTPYFKAGKYFDGLVYGLLAIKSKL